MKNLKIIIGIALLICLAPMPYGYYTLIRIVATLIFVIFALQYYKDKKEGLALAFGLFAILFQPLIKISLGKAIWNLIDVIVATLLFILWFKERKEKIC